MAGSVVQAIIKATGASPLTMAAVVATTAGDWIVLFCEDGTASNRTITCSDSVDGSYGTANFTVNDSVNGATISVWVHQVVTGGTPTFTLTRAGDTLGFAMLQITGVSALNLTPTGQHQNTPGNGADAISSGAQTTSAVCFCVALGTDADGTAGAPGAGTGFTSATGTHIAAVTGLQFGTGLDLARIEWKASVASGSRAGTFTDATNGSSHNYDNLVVFLTEGGAAAALAGGAAAAAAVTGAITTAIQAAGSASAAASSTGALTTAIQLAGGAASAATVAGALQTQIKLAAGALAASSAAGVLIGGAAALAGASVGTAVGAGALTNYATVTLVAPLYTGIGGILDPNLVWPFTAPVAGSVIYYDGSNVTILSDGEIVSNVNSCSFVAMHFDGTNWNVVIVFIQPGEVGYANAQSAATGALTTAIHLAGAALAASATTGSLSTVISLTSAAQALAAAAASLSTQIPLAGAAQAQSFATATLVKSFAGDAQETASAAGVLSTQINLMANALGDAEAPSTLSTQIMLQAAAQAFATASGILNGSVLMAGHATVAAQATGAIDNNLSAAATVVTFAIGMLSTAILLGGNAIVSANVVGDIPVPPPGLMTKVVVAFRRSRSRIHFGPSRPIRRPR
jgi:hypothetical protein